MENRDANLSVFVNVGMPHLRGEGHGGRHVGEVGGEDESGFEESAFVEGAVGAHDEDFPVVDIRIVGEADGHEIDGVLRQLWWMSISKCGAS